MFYIHSYCCKWYPAYTALRYVGKSFDEFLYCLYNSIRMAWVTVIAIIIEILFDKTSASWRE